MIDKLCCCERLEAVVLQVVASLCKLVRMLGELVRMLGELVRMKCLLENNCLLGKIDCLRKLVA
jgi:hypothetical protein